MYRAIVSTNADGAITRHTYNVIGKLQSVCWRSDREAAWTDFISDVVYAADDQVQCISYGNGVQAEFQYNQNMSTLVRKRLIRKDRTWLEDLHFVYDIMMRVSHTSDKAQQTCYFRNTVFEPTYSYTLDAISRLKTAQGREQIDAHNKIKAIGIPGEGNQLCRYLETYS